MTSWFAAAIRTFHGALRAGGALSLSVSHPLGRLSPALRTLALAGLGGMCLMACANEARAASITALGGLSEAGRTTLVEIRTSSPVAGGAGRATSCAALLAQADPRGIPLADRAAQVAGITRSEKGGRASWDGSRIAPRMHEKHFARIALLHEQGHCEDETLPRPEVIAGFPASTREWDIHRLEVFADTWGALAALREGIPSEAVLEWADLRAVGVLMNGVRRNGADAWARYHTAPAIDAVLVWADQAGGAAVSGLSDAQLGHVARSISEAHTLDRAMHANLVDGVPRIRIENGRAKFPAELPSNYGERLKQALTRTGFAPRPSDALPPAAR